MKKSLLWLLIMVLAVSMIATFSLAGCKKEEVAAAEEEEAVVEEVAEEEVAEEVTEPIKLVVWYGGVADAPGLPEWFEEVLVPAYEERNPGITIEAKSQSQDTMIPEFKAAAAVKDPVVGPDIQYFWDGIWTLEDAWEGNLAPVSDYISEEDLSHMMTLTRIWDDKAWGVGFYLAGVPIYYNKDYFTQAGLDPENPPKTWDEFMEACKALKNAGITPFSHGARDGWGNGWLISVFGYSLLDSMEEITKLTADGTFVEDKWIDVVEKINYMRKQGYFNEDAASIDMFQGWDLFPQGEVAMTLSCDSITADWVDIMGVDKVGIMVCPKIGDGELGGRYLTQINGLGISSWSEHKQEAADFLVFMHTPEMLESFYNSTGILPCDTNFDPSLITLPQQQIIYDYVLSGEKPYVFLMECFFPAQLDYEGWYPAIQMLWNDELDAEGVVQYCQDILEKWREQNQQQVEIYGNWDIPEGF